ncbi:helix-turn-helix transcriptional regulator [bacterium]|nr:helix-turn-helix transcriptional regulator [bacterium]
MRNDRLKFIADNLRAERNRKNYSQEVLAEKANLSSQTISLIERGEQIPSLLTAYDIAKALEIDINELLKGI